LKIKPDWLTPLSRISFENIDNLKMLVGGWVVEFLLLKQHTTVNKRKQQVVVIFVDPSYDIYNFETFHKKTFYIKTGKILKKANKLLKDH
jgi:hypothetical protein